MKTIQIPEVGDPLYIIVAEATLLKNTCLLCDDEKKVRIKQDLIRCPLCEYYKYSQDPHFDNLKFIKTEIDNRCNINCDISQDGEDSDINVSLPFGFKGSLSSNETVLFSSTSEELALDIYDKLKEYIDEYDVKNNSSETNND